MQIIGARVCNGRTPTPLLPWIITLLVRLGKLKAKVWSSRYTGINNLFVFVATDWVNPVAIQQIPLRAEALGIQVFPNSSQRMFHHIYDYYDFRFDLTVDDTIFQVGSVESFGKFFISFLLIYRCK